MSFSGLILASNTMACSQTSLDVVGQNLSGAQVDGYTRQVAMQQTLTSGYSIDGSAQGFLNVSSEITKVTRYRDELTQAALRREMAAGGALEGLNGSMEQVAQILGDDSGMSIRSRLNEFWGAWNQAAQSPDNIAIRSQVLKYGETLAASIRQAATRLDGLGVQVESEMSNTVNTINSLLSDIAKLNQQVAPSGPTNINSNLLMDERDRLLDKLSKLVDVQVIPDEQNAVTIYLDGSPLVSAKNSYPISLQKNPDDSFSIIASSGREIFAKQGKLKGLMDFRTQYLDQYKTSLNDFALQLMNGVNDLHSTGYGLDSSTGLDFFSGTSSRDIAVSKIGARQIALSVPKLESMNNVNVPGVQISGVASIAGQAADFAVPPAVGGEFQVNGVSILWNDTDTLEQIAQKIKDTTGLSASFDSVSQKMKLSTPPGASTITVSDVSGNFSDFMLLSGAVTTGGEPGDGLNGQRILDLSYAALLGGVPPDKTLNQGMEELASSVAFDSGNISEGLNLQNQHIASIEERRSSQSGVSMNEELMDLLRYQRTFQSGAQLAKTVDEMIQSILALK